LTMLLPESELRLASFSRGPLFSPSSPCRGRQKRREQSVEEVVWRPPRPEGGPSQKRRRRGRKIPGATKKNVQTSRRRSLGLASLRCLRRDNMARQKTTDEATHAHAAGSFPRKCPGGREEKCSSSSNLLRSSLACLISVARFPRIVYISLLHLHLLQGH